MYSLKKALLIEAIVSQQDFISRLVNQIKKKPKLIGDISFSSYDQALESVSVVEEDETRGVEIDGLKLSIEEAKSYEEMKEEFKKREDKRLKTLAIKKSKGIKTNENDETPISFNAGVFFKRSREEKLLALKEKNICLEIIKVNRLLGLNSIEDKKSASKAERVMTKQISKFLNVDGTPVNLKAIMPLYDKMIEYIEKSADVSVDSCIKAADLYIKELYATASLSERQEIDGGNFDFSLVFSRSNYFSKYIEIFSIEEVSPVIELYEDENVKIVYPTSVDAFNKEISSNNIKNGLSWCTQYIGSWQSHHEEHFVAILYDKKITSDSDPNFIISLKINYDVEDSYDLIDYDRTCDRYNEHMSEDSVRAIISDKVNESLFHSVNEKLEYFMPGYVKKNLSNISETLSSLVLSGRLDIAKEIILKSVTFSSHKETFRLIKKCISSTSDESERLLLKVMFEIAADSNFYGTHRTSLSKEIFDYEFMYDDIPTNLKFSEFYNILFSLVQNPRSHPKFLITILQSLNEDVLSSFLNKEKIIKACKIAFNTNNIESFEKLASGVVSSYSRSKALKIIDNKIEFFDAVVSSKGFKSYINKEGKEFYKIIADGVKYERKLQNASQGDQTAYGFSNINHFLSAMITTDKQACLEVLEKNNLLYIIEKADQYLMREYIDFNIKSSNKGILSLLDENEVRSSQDYAKHFDGINYSKKDFEDVMIKLLRDKEVLEAACNADESLFVFLLENTLLPINHLSLPGSDPKENHNIVNFLLESNVKMSKEAVLICVKCLGRLYESYKNVKDFPVSLLENILNYIKSEIVKVGGHWSITDSIKTSCFKSSKKCEAGFLKYTADLFSLVGEDKLIAEAIFSFAKGIGAWGGISKNEVDILKYNYINFLSFTSSQINSFLSRIVNEKCNKINSSRLSAHDIDNFKSARIIAMDGAKRYLDIEEGVYDNIVYNTKRPITKSEVLKNIHILGLSNVNIRNKENKINDFFDDFIKEIEKNVSGKSNNILGMQQGLDICIVTFANLPNYKNIKTNRYYTKNLIECISDHYQVIITNYDNEEQEKLDKLVAALIENYISFKREGESSKDAFNSIRSIFESANKNSSHIFYSQKFSPVVRESIEKIKEDTLELGDDYYQEIKQLFGVQDDMNVQDKIDDSNIQTEGALRNYIRILLS